MDDNIALPRVAAVALFGLLPRWTHERPRSKNDTQPLTGVSSCSETLASLHSFEHHVLPLLRDSLFQPAATSREFKVLHVYGHVWEPTSGCQLHKMLVDAMHRVLAGMPDVKIKSILASPLPKKLPSDYASTPRSQMSWQNISDVYLRDAPYLHALVSIKWVLALLRDRLAGTVDNTLSGGMNPSWWEAPLSRRPSGHSAHREAEVVVLLRWDTIFRTTFRWTDLNWSLLYRSNWCIPDIRDTTLNDECHALLQWKGSRRASRIHCPGGDVPDYFFAAFSVVLERVFDNALQDYAQNKYRKSSCGVLHGVLQGRIMHIEQKHPLGLTLGRYKYHELDCVFYRRRSWDGTTRNWFAPDTIGQLQPRKNHLWLGQSTSDFAYLNYSYDLRMPQKDSVCSPGPRFCGCPTAAQLNDSAVRVFFRGRRAITEGPLAQTCTDAYLT